jgi:hypothetical protein
MFKLSSNEILKGRNGIKKIQIKNTTIITEIKEIFKILKKLLFMVPPTNNSSP